MVTAFVRSGAFWRALFRDRLEESDQSQQAAVEGPAAFCVRASSMTRSVMS